MKPIDYRNAKFEEIKGRLEGRRRIVYDALRTLGPQTTRQLALVAHLDLLTVRPRVTELIDLGLVELVQPGDGSGGPSAHRGREGVYRALTITEAQRLFDQRWQAAQRDGQLALI